MDFVHGMHFKYTTVLLGRSMLEDGNGSNPGNIVCYTYQVQKLWIDWVQTNVREIFKSNLLQNIGTHVKLIFHKVATKFTAPVVQRERLSSTPAQRLLSVGSLLRLWPAKKFLEVEKQEIIPRCKVGNVWRILESFSLEFFAHTLRYLSCILVLPSSNNRHYLLIFPSLFVPSPHTSTNRL
jgi:hypothetical protein